MLFKIASHFLMKLFETFHCGTALDELLSSHQGLPRGVNYMIIGDPGVGKTTIILDMLANMQNRYLKARILFVSAEMHEIDLTICREISEIPDAAHPLCRI